MALRPLAARVLTSLCLTVLYLNNERTLTLLLFDRYISTGNQVGNDNCWIVIPELRLLCKYIQIPLRKRENIIDELSSPCSNARIESKNSEIESMCFTHSFTSVYIEHIAVNSFPSIPDCISLYQRLSLSVMSQTTLGELIPRYTPLDSTQQPNSTCQLITFHLHMKHPRGLY